jgi:hypothetical protein
VTLPTTAATASTIATANATATAIATAITIVTATNLATMPCHCHRHDTPASATHHLIVVYYWLGSPYFCHGGNVFTAPPITQIQQN